MLFPLCLVLHPHFGSLHAFTLHAALPFLGNWALGSLLTLDVRRIGSWWA